ncbi:hypothetical protein J1614_003597 [Plenodomus biglobosus]|nr:hypothetical protein J1614_003597 [Plenodomus biglobosus]
MTFTSFATGLFKLAGWLLLSVSSTPSELPQEASKPDTQVDYVPAPPIALAYPKSIEDHVERRRTIDKNLDSVVPERRSIPFIPSGHSGIEGVLDEYNRNLASQRVLDWFHAHQVEQRRIAAERQRQADIEEVARLKISILFEHYRAQYVNHVVSLADFGPQLNNAIAQLEAAIEDPTCCQDILGLGSAIVNQIFLPAFEIMKDMQAKIPLEEHASAELMSAWPLARLEKPSLPQDFFNLGHGIDVTCKYISQPTPFQNPLDPQPQQAPVLYQAWTDNSTSGNFMTPLTSGNVDIAQVATAPTAIAGRDFGSFGEFANAQKEASAAASGSTTIPAINLSAPTPGGSASMSELTHYLTTEFYELEYNAKDLINGMGEISSERRWDILTVFLKALELANGNERFFGASDFDDFKGQVDRVISKIGNMKKHEDKQTTELNRLAQQVEKYWQ